MSLLFFSIILFYYYFIYFFFKFKIACLNGGFLILSTLSINIYPISSRKLIK